MKTLRLMIEAITYLSEKDPRLADIIAEVTPLPPVESTYDVFFDLSSCIVGQQIHYRREVPVFRRLVALLPDQVVIPEHVLQLDEKDTQRLKLSTTKHHTLIRWATFWQEHPSINWEQLTDEEVRAQLSPIKGIGDWSIDMVLMYTLGRPDVFPADDYHLKQIMTQHYQLDPAAKLKQQMQEIAARWSPYRATACRYLLHWKELAKQGLL